MFFILDKKKKKHLFKTIQQINILNIKIKMNLN